MPGPDPRFLPWLTTAGCQAGRIVAGRRTPATLDFFTILGGPQTVTIRSFAYWDTPGGYGPDLAALVRLVATGRLHPEIGRVAGWADTAATLTDLYQRRIRGNAVLTVEAKENPS